MSIHHDDDYTALDPKPQTENVKQSIAIKTLHGIRQVDAFVYGQWAVHPVSTESGFNSFYSVVTHIPSGYCVPKLWPVHHVAHNLARRLDTYCDVHEAILLLMSGQCVADDFRDLWAELRNLINHESAIDDKGGLKRRAFIEDNQS